MKRRIFMRLASIAAFAGYPWVASARQRLDNDASVAPLLDTLPDRSEEVNVVHSQPSPWSICVIGVGSGGCNILDKMILRGIHGVEFVAVDTDGIALARSRAGTRIRLGMTRESSAVVSDQGREAVDDARDQIAGTLKDADMVFIVTGEGGNTGASSAPVIAEFSRSLGILTLAVAIKPFSYEGMIRQRKAQRGLAELQKQVDSLFVFDNDKLTAILGEDAVVSDALCAADAVLHNSVRAITDMITIEGPIGVDFEDIRTVLSQSGRTSIGLGSAGGNDRARLATQYALRSLFLSRVNLAKTPGLLVNITSSKRVKMKEIGQVMDTMRLNTSDDAHIVFGSIYDDEMGDEMRVTIVARGA